MKDTLDKQKGRIFNTIFKSLSKRIILIDLVSFQFNL